MASIAVPLQRMGSEFMPPLYEGTILYMPTTLPGISVTEAGKLLQQMDQKLKSFPEVELVFGKAGRADTSTDPAPFSMMEVVVELKPKEQWRRRPDLRRLNHRDGPSFAISRCNQCLVYAHQGAHRHAHHRRAHACGRQDFRAGFEKNRGLSAKPSR